MSDEHPPRDPASRILSRETLLARYRRPRDEVLVFTNGCFDVLHRGHVAYLTAARRLGTALVVAVNTDASVRRLKGAGRPVMPAHDRAFLLAALACVDAVTLFDEDTPHALIAALLPDVLVKGAEYRIEDIVGREEVEHAGGRVELVAMVPGRSTTALLDTIRNRA